MFVTIVILLVPLFIAFQFWWAIACVYAYRQLHAPAFLVQAAQGFISATFFAVILTLFATGREVSRVGVVVLLTIIMLASFVWRMMGGPALMMQHYPRGLRDILAFRRPAVDLKRRVRSK